MSVTPFGPGYANHYDLLYKDKNYLAECELLEEGFRRFGNGPIQSILDMGCGTGSHTILLAQKGYQMTGVDRSPDMLKLAHAKAITANVNVDWVEGDIKKVQLSGVFDAVILMFAVLGYQTTNEDVLEVLDNARRHLRPDGILAFDIWYGPAVLTIKPDDRIKVIEDSHGQLKRIVKSSLDIRHHLCNVHYSISRVINNQLVDYTQEIHTVRYFFPMELELFMTSSGFELVSLSAFPELGRLADENSWNALCICCAK